MADRRRTKKKQRSGKSEQRSGKGEGLRGRAKDAAGRTTGKEKLRRQGRADQTKSSLRRVGQKLRSAFRR